MAIIAAVNLILLDWAVVAAPGKGNARPWPLQVLVIDIALV
eukprot:gene42883-40477_t